MVRAVMALLCTGPSRSPAAGATPPAARAPRRLLQLLTLQPVVRRLQPLEPRRRRAELRPARRLHLRRGLAQLGGRAPLLGSELVTWLVEHEYAPDRGAAVVLGKQLGAARLLRHVCGEHELKDEPLFYNFAKAPLPLEASSGAC